MATLESVSVRCNAKALGPLGGADLAEVKPPEINRLLVILLFCTPLRTCTLLLLSASDRVYNDRVYRHIQHDYLSNSKTFQDGNGNGNFEEINSNDFLDGNWESMEMKGRLRGPRR